MNGFQYSNPYSQPDHGVPPKDVDEALELLENSGPSPSSRAWHGLVGIQSPWTLPQALRFVEWIISTSKPIESCCWVIHWLIEDGKWDLSTIYAAATYKKTSLLEQYLRKAASSSDPMLQSSALCASISLWVKLEKIQRLCSISPDQTKEDFWWISENTILLPIALRGLMLRQDDWKPAIFRADGPESLCEFKASCVEGIIHLSSDTDLQNVAGNQDLLRRLHQEASRLKIFYTKFSLLCLQLLSLTCAGEVAFEKLLNELLPHIVRSAFQTLDRSSFQPGSPRWSDSASDPSFAFVEFLYRGRPGSIGQMLTEHASVDVFLTALKEWGSVEQRLEEDQLERVVFLHQSCPGTIRQGVIGALRDNPRIGIHNAVEFLFRSAQKHQSLYASALSRDMLSPISMESHLDELSGQILSSRGLWFEWATELALSKHEDFHRPLLIICSDICHSLEVPQHVSTDTIEAFVTIATPTQLRVDGACEEGLDGDTPTATNLSRNDHSMVWIEEKRDPRGLDPTVRVVAATMLGRLARLCNGALGTRAANVANAVATEAVVLVSRDLYQRRLRLWVSLCTPENEKYLASMLHANETERTTRAAEMESLLNQKTQKVSDLQQRCETLEKEKEAISLHLVTSKAHWERQVIEVKRNAARQTREQVDVHVGKFNLVQKENQKIQTQLQSAEIELEDRRKAESEASATLKASNDNLSKSLLKVETLEQRLEACEVELKRSCDEIATVKEKLDEEEVRSSELEKELESEQQKSSQLEESEEELREGLESLFGDMVSLARIYEHQEGQLKSSLGSQTRVTKLEEKLREVQSLNKKFAEKETRIKYDNELLEKKYNKVREKLEREREDRRREDEQRRKRASGPVSYMNQLHNESRSSKTSDSYRSSKENRSMASSKSSRSQRR